MNWDCRACEHYFDAKSELEFCSAPACNLASSSAELRDKRERCVGLADDEHIIATEHQQLQRRDLRTFAHCIDGDPKRASQQHPVAVEEGRALHVRRSRSAPDTIPICMDKSQIAPSRELLKRADALSFLQFRCGREKAREVLSTALLCASRCFVPPRYIQRYRRSFSALLDHD